ncbi:phosphatase PAP2 family protein [Streptomyces sp. NPDC006654]|uniref:phosphatase PAP2 family protein n=1 Tax=Streptomyces sp. NPDC006654 TaxID=3156897 RepID=UPI0033C94417
MHATYSALDGSSLDGNLFVDGTDFARDTPALHTPMEILSSYGILALAVLLIVAWWRARHAPPALMARVVAGFLSAPLAALVNSVLKSTVAETRPCHVYPHAYALEICPGPGDYSFPSNHAAVAFAAVAALLVIDRALGAVALVIAIPLGISRVYVGAHYPHDVVAGAVVGVLVGIVAVRAGERFGGPVVKRLRTGPLRFLFDTPQAGARPVQ